MPKLRDSLIAVAASLFILQALAATGVASTVAETVQQVFITNTRTQPVPVAVVGNPVVRVANPARNLVMLEVIGAGTPPPEGDGYEFVRVLPNGTTAPGFFRVPAGQVLVVTDVDWQYDHAPSTLRYQTLRLFVENLDDPSSRHRVFESTIVLYNGEGGISESMTTGITVSSAGYLYVDTAPGGGLLQHLILRGYLTTP